MELTLERVRAETLRNNLGLRVALIAPEIAEQSVREEEGRFEALIFANAQVSDTDDAVASTLDSSQARNYFVQPGVRIPLRTGGQVEISTPINRLRTDNQFTFLNPAYTSDLQLSLSHQLLRGAGRRAGTFQLRVADLDRQVSTAQTRLEVIRQLAAADRRIGGSTPRARRCWCGTSSTSSPRSSSSGPAGWRPRARSRRSRWCEPSPAWRAASRR